MSLPIYACAHEDVTLPDGQVVPVRGLSRAEAIQVRAAAPDNAAMEKLTLSAGLDASADDIDAWYATTPTSVVEQLVDTIVRLSGLDPQSAG
ncbi:MAG TPA: hypothetical protein VF244_10440 [Acidimicrobiales bacterium]